MLCELIVSLWDKKKKNHVNYTNKIFPEFLLLIFLHSAFLRIEKNISDLPTRPSSSPILTCKHECDAWKVWATCGLHLWRPRRWSKGAESRHSNVLGFAELNHVRLSQVGMQLHLGMTQLFSISHGGHTHTHREAADCIIPTLNSWGEHLDFRMISIASIPLRVSKDAFQDKKKLTARELF